MRLGVRQRREGSKQNPVAKSDPSGPQALSLVEPAVWLNDRVEGLTGQQHPTGGASAPPWSSHLTAVGTGHPEHPLLMLPAGRIFPSSCSIRDPPTLRLLEAAKPGAGGDRCVCTHQRTHTPSRDWTHTHLWGGGPRPQRPSAGPHWLSYSNSSNNS